MINYQIIKTILYSFINIKQIEENQKIKKKIYMYKFRKTARKKFK